MIQMKRIVVLLTFFSLFMILFVIWNNIILLIIAILISLILLIIRRSSVIKGTLYYIFLLSLVLIPINVGLNYNYGLFTAILLSMIPLMRILAASLIFLVYSEYVGLDDFLDALTIILPKEIALAIILAFLLVPLMIKELEDIYLAQMMRCLALAPFHKKLIYLIRAFLFSAVMLAINRAIRIAEAIELYY